MFNILQPNGDSPGPFTLQKPAVASVWCQDASAYLRSPGTPDLHLKCAAFERRKYKKCVTCITVYAALPGRFPFLSQVSKGSEEAFLLAIRPVVLNLKGWIAIYTMYVNFMRLRLSNVFFSKGLNWRIRRSPREHAAVKVPNLLRNETDQSLRPQELATWDWFINSKALLEQWIRQNSLTSPTSYHDKVPVTLFYK